MVSKKYTLAIGEKEFVAEFSDLADQANGSVIFRYGNSAVLATAVMSRLEREGMSYFPLTVDYEERFYAAGAILGSRFMRREGRPSEEAVLSGRIVDRTIRPLFDPHIRNDIQVIITVLSIEEDDPDILAVNAASLALAVSDIPWNGPVSAIRIGKHKGNDELKVLPSYDFRRSGDLEYDLTVCGKKGNINMLEVGAFEASEKVLTAGLKEATKEIEKIQTWQKKIVAEIGKEKRVIEERKLSKEVLELFEKKIAHKLKDAVFAGSGKAGIENLKYEWTELLKENLPDLNVADALDHYENAVDKLLHREAIQNDRRADGREMGEVRKLYAKAGGFSPIIHGSGTFYRGGTHVFSALTLGGPGDSLLIDSMEEQSVKKRYMHHYNFPPFSVGETGRVGGFNRRMIGHGMLAEKALIPVLPNEVDFPYTIRIVSESMASNGSTSMASVCGSTLALMDSGVPIKAPVAGVAIGLMMENDKKYKILTDIQGPEDHYGDMDFKVAGTREGVTAVQMDVKVDGVSISVLCEAFEAAKRARLTILDVIEAEIDKPREKISPNAPEIISLQIKPDQIGLVIGPGGKNINKIREDTCVDDITIEDSGMVYITGKNGTAQKAHDIIQTMTHEYKAGERFDGKVTRLMDFGVFVEIAPNTEGLVHISEIAPFRIESVNGILNVGDRVPVIIKKIDEKKRINLSIKDVDPNFVKNPEKKV
ncbi:polyribonucleotide nucleotidyltransferase [Patescibacteria group bacterium]|nr:polyribonucleotide nucleotidyltransferase [Patescibacteria group bacterium]